MNVTLKLPEALCRAARHRAVDQSKSLSQWMADLLRKELGESPESKSSRTWQDAFSGEGDEAFLRQDFPQPDRQAMKARKFDFQD